MNDETYSLRHRQKNLGLSRSVNQHPNYPPVHQDLSTCYGWRFKNAILRLANVGQRKFETQSLSPLGVRSTEDLGAASQTLLVGS